MLNAECGVFSANAECGVQSAELLLIFLFIATTNCGWDFTPSVKERKTEQDATLYCVAVSLFLTIGDILSNVERNFYAVCKALARRHFLFADTIDNRETAVDTVATAKLGKLNHTLKTRFFELRAANGLIFFVTRRVERNVDEVDFVLQVGHDVALVDKVALTVRV